MKKKIVSLLLAMALVLAYAIPVAATETEQPSTEPAPAELTEPLEKSVYENEIIPKTSGEAVSSDPEIQKAYDEFIALETAFNNRDYAALESAYSTMENNNDSEDWTEAQDEDERVFLTEGFFTEADRELFTVFFNDIEDVYTEAKAMLEDNGNGNTNTNTQPTDKPDTVSSSPETGDDFNAVPYAVAMVMAAAGAILAVKRRKA